MVDIIPVPPETQEARIARLRGEIAACGRNHALLRRGSPKVVANNETLRSGIRRLIDGLPADPDLAAVAEKLEDALLLPFLYRRDMPAETPPEDDAEPVDPTDLADFLDRRLRTASRTNYLIQEAGAPVVWNSDAIRAVLTQLRDELSPPGIEDEPENPLTLDQAMIMAIVDEIDAIMKAGADRPDK